MPRMECVAGPVDTCVCGCGDVHRPARGTTHENENTAGGANRGIVCVIRRIYEVLNGRLSMSWVRWKEICLDAEDLSMVSTFKPINIFV